MAVPSHRTSSPLLCPVPPPKQESKVLLSSILECSAKLVLIACLPVRAMTNLIKHCQASKFDPPQPMSKAEYSGICL